MPAGAMDTQKMPAGDPTTTQRLPTDTQKLPPAGDRTKTIKLPEKSMGAGAWNFPPCAKGIISGTCPRLHEYHVVLLLHVRRLDLHRDGFPDEVSELRSARKAVPAPPGEHIMKVVKVHLAGKSQ